MKSSNQVLVRENLLNRCFYHKNTYILILIYSLFIFINTRKYFCNTIKVIESRVSFKMIDDFFFFMVCWSELTVCPDYRDPDK